MPMLTRRASLFGLTAALASWGGSLALANVATEKRFVVVNLRGALDGLAAVIPYGDPDLTSLRAALVPPAVGQPDGMLDLGGFFALHPLLSHVHEMYLAGEATIIHAVAGPYRERSHFIAQDLLESGAEQRLTSGWLNRCVVALAQADGSAAKRAATKGAAGKGVAGKGAGATGGAGVRAPMAIGTSVPLLLRGEAPVENWAPSNLATPQPDLYAAILRLNDADPVIGPAIRAGLSARGFSKDALADHETDRRRMDFPVLARTAGTLLAAPNGPRIAALEIGGWDSHAGQTGRLVMPLTQLDRGLRWLRQALGPAWASTVVLVMTEFGRTVRTNGTGGTDHGTATVAFLLGGAVKGGRIVVDWPGLGAGKLFEDRDLAPTRDLRAVAMALATDHLGVAPAALGAIFPGADRVSPIGGLVN